MYKVIITCFNSGIIISTAFVFVHSYRRVDVQERLKSTVSEMHPFHNERHVRSVTEDVEIAKKNLLGLQPGEDLLLQTSLPTSQGYEVQKFQEIYKGIPVFEGIITLEVDRDGRLTGDASGTLVQNIDEDIIDLQPLLSDKQALEILINVEEDYGHRYGIEVQNTEIWVYPDNDGVAKLVYHIQYLVDSFPPKRPSAIIDANSGMILSRNDAIGYVMCSDSAIVGIGGNPKIGATIYGKSPYCIQPTQSGTTCFLENEHVRVVNMNHTKTEGNGTQQTMSFPCGEGPIDTVNGPYSPALDAYFAGTVVGKMYRDWIGGTPLTEKVVLRVHYGDGWDSALWNGNNVSFGDGSVRFYPMVSLDIVGHEIAHGVVERYSKAIMTSQSGGINEAFADIMGLATVAYFEGTDANISWLIGADVLRNDTFLRSFKDPAIDGRSIAHVSDFTRYTGPHQASGVFRLAFYNIVAKHDITIKNAFRAFDRANKLYWHHRSTFRQAGCGVIKAAYDLGQNINAYRRGFEDVGVRGCDINSRIRNLVNGRTYTGIVLSYQRIPFFKFTTPEWAQNVTIIVENPENGQDVEIEVCNKYLASDNNFDDCVTCANFVEFQVDGDSISFISLFLPDISNAQNVSLTASYTCNPNYMPPGDLSNIYVLLEYCIYLYNCERSRFFVECKKLL